MIVWPFLLLIGLLPALLWWRDNRDKHDKSDKLVSTNSSVDATIRTPAVSRPALLSARLRGQNLTILPAGTSSAMVSWRFWSAILLVVLALARPQWQAPEPSSQPKAEAQVVVVMSYSESMLAVDLLPSPLERARNLVSNFFDALPGAEVALIGYAGDAHLLAPLSRDQAAARRLLASLAPRHFLNQGNDTAAALEVALDQFSARMNKRLLILVALGDQEPASAVLPALKVRMQAQAIDLLVVGSGVPEGASLLQVGGRYFEAGDRAGLRQALADIVFEIRGEAQPGLDDQSQQRLELFVWLLLLAMFLLAWSLCTEFSAGEVLARHWRLRARKLHASKPTAVLLIALTLAMPEPGRSQVKADADLHPGDPYIEARLQIQRLTTISNPTSADYMEFSEVVIDYALFHRSHAHPVIESLFTDGFIAIEQGRLLDAGNPAWDELQARLERLAQRAPATRPPDQEPGDPANEQVDADVLVDVATEPDAQETPPEADGQDVGGGQAEVYDEQEMTNPALVLPLHQLQAIRELATPADLFRAQQENEINRQSDVESKEGSAP